MTPELGQMFAVFRPSGKIEASFGQLPSPRTARTVVEGLIWPFRWHLDALLPSAAVERMTIGRLTQALVVAAPIVLLSVAKSPGTFARDGDLGHLEGDVAAVADDLRADLDQLLLQTRQRLVFDRLRCC